MSKKCERYGEKAKAEAKNGGEWVDGGFRSSGDVSLSAARVDPDVAEKYERYVKKAKEEAKNGNLLKSIEYFRRADSIHPSEKIKGRIAKLEEAQQVKLQNEQDDEFVDVMGSGFTLYKELYDKLFEHQKEGVAFLYSLYRDGRKGGILADDMGLGKTIQVIAFLSGMFDSELARTVLLIMPTTLISNWVKEFEKWTPGMRVTEFHGVSKKERARNLEKIQRKGGVIITTYQMLINNWQQLATYNEREFVWDYIILDEAHKIKSSSTKTSKSCAALLAKNRVLLTGTPVQNNLRELWALFDFACQGTLLGTAKTFKMEYENPITRARERDATPGEKALGLKISENLMNIIRPYFMRRTKSDVQNKKDSNQHLVSQSDIKVAEMPSLTRKNDLIIWVYLSAIQEEVYRKFLSLDQIKELLMTTRSPLAELTILKKLCDHPRLLSSRACIQLGLEGDEVSEEELGAVTKFDHLSDESLIEESGKLLLLIELLHKLKDEGHRTLVFSQSRKMLDMVDRILTNRGFKIMRIDGTVSLLDREKRISLFQRHREYSVLLLTTQVGGVGLTLTAADRVVIFDPSWNPATDAQAVDRAYRIGQQANVVIYRLITCGTVEEKIYRRQIFKDSLIRQTTGDKKNPFRYFSKQDLKELFTLEDTRTSTTQIQLQNMHSSQRKTDSGLDEHIAYLHTLPIFGISDHDLIYAHESSNHEDDECENEHEVHYIKERVQKAHDLVQMESQMNEQLMEQIRKGTEGAWLRQVAPPEKPKPRSLPSSKPVTSPVIVDLTQQEMADISCHMDSLVIEDPENHSLASIKREFPDQLNGQGIHLVSDDYGEENSHSLSFKNKGTNDVDCQMASLIIEDSDGEENLPPAPFKCEPPSEICIQKNSFITEDDAEEKDRMPSVLYQSDSPTQDANSDVSHEHHNTGDAASKLSLVGKFSPLASPVSYPLESFASKTVKLDQFGMGPGNMSVKESSLRSQLQCDFNLVLEDSADKEGHGVSMGEMEIVMETSVAQENGPILVLDDSLQNMSQECDNLSHSSGDEMEKSDAENMSEAIVNSLPRLGNSPDLGQSPKDDMNGTNSYREVQANGMDTEDEEIFHTGRRKAARRICSESESEISVFLAGENERMYSPFSSPSAKGLSASTPKIDKSMSGKLFPQSSTPSRRRSIASRRSLVHVAVEEAIDVEESIVDVNEESSEEEEEKDEEDDILKDEAEEAKEELEMTEEEPAGDTLPEEESVLTSEEYESDSFVVKTSSIEEESADESTGEVELLTDEQVDCLTQDAEGIHQKVPCIEDRYATLVQRGKLLKDSGNVKEALDCFLKALDIRSGDPEVMMITLGLYRQLS
ncbi:PREDICTED: DNA excision repair protein ERCC-6-like [Nanorana parkeri]|uniref:DNA excision repair protein ERCC-6-like n=1 Tax=Nanorana parkeri TaxID=125878 RepID=UPI000854A283|nr:PREDICTED: DNA excision repair protein ERCC-6-like [Nanorana parkeri]